MYGNTVAGGAISGAQLGQANRAVLGGEDARAVPEIGLSLERLNRSIVALDDALGTLHGRLEPVRRECPRVEKDHSPAVSGTSPICRAVTSHAESVESLHRGVLRMLAELEI